MLPPSREIFTRKNISFYMNMPIDQEKVCRIKMCSGAAEGFALLSHILRRCWNSHSYTSHNVVTLLVRYFLLAICPVCIFWHIASSAISKEKLKDQPSLTLTICCHNFIFMTTSIAVQTLKSLEWKEILSWILCNGYPFYDLKTNRFNYFILYEIISHR